MRRSVAVCRSGLAAVAAAVLLAACSGSGDDTSASSSSSARASTSSTSTTTAEATGATGSEFCTQAASALQSAEPALSGSQNDPATLGPALQQAADKFHAIKPPAEISKDWAAVADGIEQLGKIVVKQGTGDPASQSAQQELGAVVGKLTTP